MPTNIKPYIQIARFDHWFKNVFMLPGVILAFYAVPQLFGVTALCQLLLALLATGFVASSNYVINELLDAPFDAFHPMKKFRPIPSGEINKSLVYCEWILLAVIGLALAASLGSTFFLVALSLWIMGCIYNIPPFRSKDKPYLDVLSESVNNPIRLLLGWYATGIAICPPLSLLLAYWMIGAFFMAVKRFAEYRKINDPERAANYRQSFIYYNEPRLLTSILYYAVTFGLFFGIFLIRYKMELILSAPPHCRLHGLVPATRFSRRQPGAIPRATLQRTHLHSLLPALQLHHAAPPVHRYSSNAHLFSILFLKA